jgi:hypothetical protein
MDSSLLSLMCRALRWTGFKKDAPAMTKAVRLGDQMLAILAVIMVFGVGGYLGYIFFGSINW